MKHIAIGIMQFIICIKYKEYICFIYTSYLTIKYIQTLPLYLMQIGSLIRH